MTLGKQRRKIYENEKLLLHSEVDGVCPNCPSVLIYEKNGRNQKGFEIAHIYPFNPTNHEIDLLKNEARLNSDSDHSDNLICLCIPCHDKYDKNKTIEEYRDLVQKKKTILKRNKERELWNQTKIEKEIYEVIEILVNQELDYNDIIEFNPKKINEKIHDTIGFLIKRQIHSNVQDYFYKIQTKFKDIEFTAPMTSEVIASQIKTHYLLLCKEGRSQHEIYNAMVLWLYAQTNQNNREASEIIICYFIQNCEIF